MSRPRSLQPPTRSGEPPLIEEPGSSRGWITDDQISYHGASSHAPQPTISQEPSWQYSLQSIMAPPVTSYDGIPLPAPRTSSENESSRATAGYKDKNRDIEGRGTAPEDDVVVQSTLTQPTTTELGVRRMIERLYWRGPVASTGWNCNEPTFRPRRLMRAANDTNGLWRDEAHLNKTVKG